MEADMPEVGEPDDPTFGILRPRPPIESNITTEAYVVDPYDPLKRRTMTGHHPWSEIKRVRDIKRADDGLPESDSEPTTGAPLANELVYGSEATSQRPWTTGLVVFLCVAVAIIAWGIGMVAGSAMGTPNCNFGTELYGGPTQGCVPRDAHDEHEGGITLPDPMGVGNEAHAG